MIHKMDPKSLKNRVLVEKIVPRSVFSLNFWPFMIWLGFLTVFGLIFGGVLTKEAAIQSIFGLIFVLAGFRVGEILRNKTSQNWFEKAVLIAFLFMGIRLIGVGLF